MGRFLPILPIAIKRSPRSRMQSNVARSNSSRGNRILFCEVFQLVFQSKFRTNITYNNQYDKRAIQITPAHQNPPSAGFVVSGDRKAKPPGLLIPPRRPLLDSPHTSHYPDRLTSDNRKSDPRVQAPGHSYPRLRPSTYLRR